MPIVYSGELLSSSDGVPPKGCRLCDRGAKMVLYITGVCTEDCFYCPLSEEKKGRDVVYANERGLDTGEFVPGMIEEARRMRALGTGITGGDPIVVLERTLKAIEALKGEFGRSHHIHLYTSSPVTTDALERLFRAGLDEIRFHPPIALWRSFRSFGRGPESSMEGDARDFHRSISAARMAGLKVGLEVPAVPDGPGEVHSEGLFDLARYAARVGLDFMNINELEASHTNADAFGEMGYSLVGVSMAVEGSMELAREVIASVRHPGDRTTFHICSSVYKDSVQMRKRLVRTAKNTSRDFEVVTEDGTLLRGIVVTDSPEDLARTLERRYDVPAGLMSPTAGMLVIAPWVLEEIASDLDIECYISEVYPTFDALEVERIPLSRRGPTV